MKRIELRGLWIDETSEFGEANETMSLLILLARVTG